MVILILDKMFLRVIALTFVTNAVFYVGLNLNLNLNLRSQYRRESVFCAPHDPPVILTKDTLVPGTTNWKQTLCARHLDLETSS